MIDGATIAGQHMIGAVTVRSVRVPVAVVARQQSLQGVDEVVVGTRAGLDDRHPGGRVRDEDIAQPVAPREAERAH